MPLPRPEIPPICPGVTIFGLKPCCAACVQKFAKVGGGSTDVTISTPADLNAVICDVKFSANGSKLPVFTTL